MVCSRHMLACWVGLIDDTFKTRDPRGKITTKFHQYFTFIDVCETTDQPPDMHHDDGLRSGRLGERDRMQEGCELFSCAEEPTQVKEGGNDGERGNDNENDNDNGSSSNSNNKTPVATTDQEVERQREARQQRLRVRWKCGGNPLVVQG